MIVQYLRKQDRTPYGAVVGELSDDGGVKAGWSLHSVPDQRSNDPGLAFTKKRARQIAQNRLRPPVEFLQDIRRLNRQIRRKLYSTLFQVMGRIYYYG